MRFDRRFEIVDLVQLGGCAAGVLDFWRLNHLCARMRRRHGLPGTVEGIEDGISNRFLPIVPAIHGAFHDIAQFAHIARPGMLFELLGHVTGEAGPPVPADFRRHPPPEIIGQHADIALAHAQRRESHHLETETVEKIGTKLAPRRLGLQILVRRRDDPHIDPHRTRRADPRDFPILDRAQEPFLRAHRQCAQFVEEQRALVRFLEAAGPLASRAGKGAGFVPEQFGFDQRFGQSRAVHRHQRLVPARRKAVQTLGDQFLARSALSDNQHRAPHGRRATGPLHRVEKGARLPDKLVFPFHGQGIGNFAYGWQEAPSYPSSPQKKPKRLNALSSWHAFC